jgi:nitrate reductase gamma subunit
VSAAVGILVGVGKLTASLGFKDEWADAILIFHKFVIVGALFILAYFLFRDLIHVYARRSKP